MTIRKPDLRVRALQYLARREHAQPAAPKGFQQGAHLLYRDVVGIQVMGNGFIHFTCLLM